jgi:hypothetical protein
MPLPSRCVQSSNGLVKCAAVIEKSRRRWPGQQVRPGLPASTAICAVCTNDRCKSGLRQSAMHAETEYRVRAKN